MEDLTGPAMEESREPQVEIADDGLSAKLIVPEYIDRETLNHSLFNALLTKAGVELESCTKKLADDFIAMANEAPSGAVEGIIAEGVPATHSKDAYIEWTLDELDTSMFNNEDNEGEADLKDSDGENASEDEDESVCFYNQSVYTVVKDGDVLGKVYPEVPGEEGRDVTGKTLAARTPKPLDLKYDETIGINEDNQIVAKSEGVLIINGKTALISDTIEVKENVDFNTGNIDFNGNIIVREGVKDCFVVKASEDIEIRGLIEASSIIAGNDLRALGGFAGREQGSAQVNGNLYAKYLDAVNVQVQGDLCVDREVINCQTNVLGDIKCPRGALIGGETKVSGSVEVLDIGAGAQPFTKVHIGLLSQLDPLIAQLSQLIRDLIEQRQKLLDEHERLASSSGPDTAQSQQAQLNQITYQIADVQKHLDRAEPSLKRARERAEDLRTVDVFVKRKLHPNAVLICGEFTYRMTDEIKGPLRITVNKRGQLEYQQGENKPVLLSTEADLRGAA